MTIFQFAEGLSDRQAADAVRGRIDWKYALCLELEHPGFDASVLSEFRTRLIAAGAETVLFETLLTTLKEAGLVSHGAVSAPIRRMLAAIQVLNRLELVGETLRHALNTLAVVAPDWLRSQVPADWYPRYSRRFEEYRLPDALTARTALAEQIGADGRALLAMVFASETDAWLRQVPAVETLRQVWVQQFSAEEPARWRAAQDLPPSAVVISSPYDPEARYCEKRETIWTGYKAHLTETCDDDLPNIVTDVDTTTATTVDHAVTAAVQVRLARRGLVPREQLVDTGYVTADHLVTSQADHQCTLLGPIHADYSWQARAGAGFGAAHFAIEWEQERAICPQGRVSRIWKPTHDSALTTTSSTSASITRTVAIVRSASSACPPTASAPSPSTRSRCMKPSTPRGGVSTHRSSASSTAPARGSKGPSRRAYPSATCAVRAIAASRRPDSCTCSSPPHSISTAWRRGSPSAHARRRVSRRSPDSPQRRDLPGAARLTAQVRQQHLDYRHLQRDYTIGEADPLIAGALYHHLAPALLGRAPAIVVRLALVARIPQQTVNNCPRPT